MGDLQGQKVIVPCQECGERLPADSGALRLAMIDEGLLTYCVVCWEREFGGEPVSVTNAPGSTSKPTAGEPAENSHHRVVLLDHVLELWRRQGWTVESQHEFGATISRRGGFDGPVDFFRCTFTLNRRRIRRRAITIDETGRVLQQKL
jgi:hypothetical protein